MPDIHNPISSVPDARVRISVWMASAWSRSWASIARTRIGFNTDETRRAKSRLTADEHKELFAERLRQRFAVERIKQRVDPPFQVVDEALLLRL